MYAADREVGAARCPLGAGVPAARSGPPSFSGGARGCGPRVWALLAPPRPRGPTASLPALRREGWGLAAGVGPWRAAPPAPPALTGLSGPRPLQQPLRGPHVLRLHRLHQLLLLPHGAVGPQQRGCSVRSARLRGEGGPAALAASSSLPRHPLPAQPSSRARAPRGGLRVTGGGRPWAGAAGAGRGRGTWHRLPDAWVPLLRPLTSGRPRRPRARRLGSAPTSGPGLPRRPLPTCAPRAQKRPLRTPRGPGDRQGWGQRPPGLDTEPRPRGARG